MLVRRRRRSKRPEGERLEAAGEARVEVGAGAPLGVELDGPLDRNAVPGEELGAGREARVLERGVDFA